MTAPAAIGANAVEAHADPLAERANERMRGERGA